MRRPNHHLLVLLCALIAGGCRSSLLDKTAFKKHSKSKQSASAGLVRLPSIKKSKSSDDDGGQSGVKQASANFAGEVEIDTHSMPDGLEDADSLPIPPDPMMLNRPALMGEFPLSLTTAIHIGMQNSDVIRVIEGDSGV